MSDIDPTTPEEWASFWDRMAAQQRLRVEHLTRTADEVSGIIAEMGDPQTETSRRALEAMRGYRITLACSLDEARAELLRDLRRAERWREPRFPGLPPVSP